MKRNIYVKEFIMKGKSQAVEKNMLKELCEAGFQYRNIDAIYKKEVLQLEEANIILKYLQKFYEVDWGAGEILARSLMSVNREFNPEILIDLYLNSDLNSSLKWTIGYVISKARTSNVSNWIIEQLNAKPEFQNDSFLWAIGKKINFDSEVKMRDFLKGLFGNFYSSETYQKLLKKYFVTEDVEFIKEKIAKLPAKTQSMYNKIIDHIENRKVPRSHK